MSIIDIGLDGKLAKGLLCGGNKLLDKGLCDTVHGKRYRLRVVGRSNFLFYFTNNQIIYVSEGSVETFYGINVLKIPFESSVIFLEKDRDYPDYTYRLYLSLKSLRVLDVLHNSKKFCLYKKGD
jgi:hypothetical protein